MVASSQTPPNANEDLPTLTHAGEQFVLGYTSTYYGIYTRLIMATPDPKPLAGKLVVKFDFADEAWPKAWAQFCDLEFRATGKTPTDAATAVKKPDAILDRSLRVGLNSGWSVTEGLRYDSAYNRFKEPDKMNRPVKQKFEPLAAIAASFSTISLIVRGLVIISSGKLVQAHISSFTLSSKVGAYLFAAVGFIVGLRARRIILESTGKKTGRLVAGFAIFGGWLIIIIALGLDIWPQLHKLYDSL